MIKRFLFPSIHLARVAQTGTFKLTDLREGGQYGGQTLAEFGVPNALNVASALTSDYNSRLTQNLLTLAEVTTERFESAPIVQGIRMERTSEFTNVRTQKGGSNVGRGFPLVANGVATGWTEHFDVLTTVAAYVSMVEAAQSANDTRVREDMAAALFDPMDRPLYESLELDAKFPTSIINGIRVKPLYNGDDEVPQMSPNGKTFTSGHNHYLGSNGLSNAALDAAIVTVGEHSVGNRIVVYIAEADASTFKALPNFAPSVPANIVLPNTSTYSTQALDTTQTDNRLIGYTASGYAVYTKPWMIPGYAMPYNLAGPKAVKMRQPRQAVLRGLRLKGQEGNTVFKASTWESIFGFGVSNRGGASLLHFGPKDAGNTTFLYEKPTLPGDE